MKVEGGRRWSYLSEVPSANNGEQVFSSAFHVYLSPSFVLHCRRARYPLARAPWEEAAPWYRRQWNLDSSISRVASTVRFLFPGRGSGVGWYRFPVAAWHFFFFFFFLVWRAAYEFLDGLNWSDFARKRSRNDSVCLVLKREASILIVASSISHRAVSIIFLCRILSKSKRVEKFYSCLNTYWRSKSSLYDLLKLAVLYIYIFLLFCCTVNIRVQ